MERRDMKKIYMDDNECTALSTLRTKNDFFNMTGQGLLKHLCLLDYPEEVLSSPIYKGFIARAIKAEAAYKKKTEEIFNKYNGNEPFSFYSINIATGTLVIRDSSDPLVVKDMTSEVEESYRGAIKRYNFLMGREIDNVAFLILRHLEDKDDCFLDSDIVQRRIERFEEADVQRLRFESGTAALIFDDESVELSSHISYSRYVEAIRVVV